MIDLSSENPERIADWVEIVASSGHGAPFSIQKLQEMSENIAGVSRMQISYAFKRIRLRSRILGERYPFLVDDEYLATKLTVADSFYLRLLYLSPGSWRNALDFKFNTDVAGKIFEDVAASALSSFFGENTHSLNFGFPSKSGRPADFPSAIQWLSKMTNIRLGIAFRPPRMKDGGVDLFVWKSFGDKKPGVPIMLVQCTIMEDFVNKIGDIDVRLWSSWLSSDIEPLVALAIPGIVDSDDIWNEITTRGILLDRIRLAEVAGEHMGELDADSAQYLRSVVEGYRRVLH